MTLLSSITDFESSIRQHRPGAGREARMDTTKIGAMAIILVEMHRHLARMHGELGSARDVTDRNGVTRQAVYNIGASVISQADYLADDLSPEASAVLYAEIERLLG